jgi:nitrite reductase/ring-hydroxylating ferredoxin subunit/DMSO/TMAO reductase YedYZ heme-binding membrane subunit
MSVSYQAVGWNRTKKIYDAILAAGVALYLAIFVGIGSAVHPNATAETLLIRGLGTAAFLLLHIILSIGPLCRLDRRFLPLLYNRRHLGVTMFVLALAHGAFSIFQFHALGNLNPFVSLFVSNTRYNSVADFPFQALGFFALLILFLMAAISHDFWLHNLTAPVWKRLHMLVYIAYALLVAHVTLGALQSETSPLLAVVMALGLTVVLGLHLAAATVERRNDRSRAALSNGYVPVCNVDSIPEKRACVVSCEGERVAVFKYGGRISAVSNVCRHQNGPLGEGKIIDGCITCPWHGYQYLPDSGAAPPPFTEKVSTFRTLVVGNQVFVHPSPLPPGTRVEPSLIPQKGTVMKDVQRV